MRRSSRAVSLILISSPLILAGCHRRTPDDGNYPAHSGGGYYGGGGFRGGSAGATGHASPAGGFGGFGHASGAGE